MLKNRSPVLQEALCLLFKCCISIVRMLLINKSSHTRSDVPVSARPAHDVMVPSNCRCHQLWRSPQP